MILLIIGLVLFVGIHFLPMFEGLRSAVVEKLGENVYKAVFSIVSIVGLVLMVMGYKQTEVTPLWDTPSWGRQLLFLLMIPATILFVAANFKSHIRNRLRHPMLIGTIIWSLGHLIVDGHLAALFLFGSLTAFAVIDIISVNSRKAAETQELIGIKYDVIAVIVGLGAYVVILKLHGLI